MSGFLELFSQYDVLGAFLVNIELTLWSALFSGIVDAVTTDDIILAGLASASRGKLKVVGKPFTQEYYGVGIKKGDTQLATKINNAIVDMIQDGSWENAISDNTKGTNYTPDVRYNPPIPDEGEEA